MKKRLLFLTVILLALFGLVMIYSASNIWAEYKYNDAFKYLKNQGLFFIFGILLMIIISKINVKSYYKNANKLLLIGFILLLLVLIPGIGTIRNGSRSWFNFGLFSLQPSDVRKDGMTSNQHGPYVRGDTRVTMGRTEWIEAATRRESRNLLPVRIGVCNPTP